MWREGAVHQTDGEGKMGWRGNKAVYQTATDAMCSRIYAHPRCKRGMLVGSSRCSASYREGR